MCQGGELFAELFAPESTARRAARWAYYLVLVAIFAFGVYLAIGIGTLR